MKLDVKVARAGKKLDADLIQHNLMRTLVERSEKVQKDFDKTTQTWKKTAAEFNIQSSDQLIREVSTNSEIYGYLDQGTSVRYATMTPGFQAKTRVEWIGSAGGAGGLRFINKKRPKPGIKARKFAATIAKKHEPLLKIDIEKLVNSL